jgi:hypothetical protein
MTYHDVNSPVRLDHQESLAQVLYSTWLIWKGVENASRWLPRGNMVDLGSDEEDTL